MKTIAQKKYKISICPINYRHLDLSVLSLSYYAKIVFVRTDWSVLYLTPLHLKGLPSNDITDATDMFSIHFFSTFTSTIN